MKIFISFKKYLENAYADKSDNMKKIYGSFESFKKSALKNNIYSDWIASLENTVCDHRAMNSIAKSMNKYGNVEPRRIPTHFVILARQLNVELPLVEGCLTSLHWETFFAPKN